jgi:hypothetical protein
MITISLLGLDPFLAQRVSHDIHKKLVGLFGCHSEDLLVYGSESYLFHDGVDQTNWHALVHVKAPIRYEKVQASVADYLVKRLQEQVIHIAIEFEYYDPKLRVASYNPDYPRFVNEANQVEVITPKKHVIDEVYQGDVFVDKASKPKK